MSTDAPLRLALVTDIVTPYMVAVLEALARQCELTAIFCSDTGTRAMPWTFGELGFRHEVVGGLTIRRAHPDATDFYLSPRILAAIARARPDAVIAAGYSFPTLYASAYCGLRRRPLAIYSEGTSASEASLGRAQRVARAVLLRRAAAGVAISRPAAARFRELGLAPDRVFLAPYTTELEDLWEAARRRSYALDGPLRVAAIGRLIPRKGVDRLIEAAQRARDRGADVAVDLVGSGPAEDDLRRLVARLGMDGAVRFHGFVDQSELPARYAAAGAYAFPSTDDPFGVVLLEAMAAGLPVVASPRAGATGDLVVHGANGFAIDPDDLDGWADALAQLAADEALRERLGRAAHEATLGRTPDAAARGYLDAIETALGRRGANGS